MKSGVSVKLVSDPVTEFFQTPAGAELKRQFPPMLRATGKTGGVTDWSGFIHALPEVNYSGVFNYELRMVSMPLPERIAAIEETGKKHFTRPAD